MRRLLLAACLAACACPPPANAPSATQPTTSFVAAADAGAVAGFLGDLAARRFHRPGCDVAANVPLATVEEALAQGYLPCERCRPPMESPVERLSDQTSCQRDEDCALHVGNCGCEPCGLVWQRALNRKTHEWLMSEYARESCPVPDCAPCGVILPPGVTSPYIGRRAVCQDGACRAVYW